MSLSDRKGHLSMEAQELTEAARYAEEALDRLDLAGFGQHVKVRRLRLAVQLLSVARRLLDESDDLVCAVSADLGHNVYDLSSRTARYLAP